MKEHSHTEVEEDRLDTFHESWQERREQVSEHPPTGAAKESLLRALAEEALAKGNPVLVIPLDSAAEEESEVSEHTDHALRLPRNTTVIFSGKESFPATAAQLSGHPSKALDRAGTEDWDSIILTDPQQTEGQHLIFGATGMGKTEKTINPFATGGSGAQAAERDGESGAEERR